MFDMKKETTKEELENGLELLSKWTNWCFVFMILLLISTIISMFVFGIESWRTSVLEWITAYCAIVVIVCAISMVSLGNQKDNLFPEKGGGS